MTTEALRQALPYLSAADLSEVACLMLPLGPSISEDLRGQLMQGRVSEIQSIVGPCAPYAPVVSWTPGDGFRLQPR